MTEMQISKITVRVEDTSGYGATDEAYRILSSEIVVNGVNNLHTQQVALTHEVLGSYLGCSIQNDTLTEIADAIIDALSLLE